MSENLLISLNDSQKIAAQHIDGPLLILAGAGSGKTKTITTRLAFLISIGIDPSSILTLTFTNKDGSTPHGPHSPLSSFCLSQIQPIQFFQAISQ